MHIYLLKKDGMEKERVNKQNKAFSEKFPTINKKNNSKIT
ncbi:unnamed protein product [marine sediment metagenome]|uniref:Uncharacterized protein n=1 Tax=marine sediment metagenome TaxID=412755 RepID=X1CNI8_9ZZZZ